MSQKLHEIGQKLNITESDIRDLGRAGLTNKILYWIITVIIAIITFVIGFFMGQSTCTSPGGGYPYAGSVIPSLLANKKKSSRVAILLFSAIAFLIAMRAYPAFGQAIKYNVYRR